MSKRKTYINKILCVLLSTMMLFSNISVAFAESMTNDSTSQAEVSADVSIKTQTFQKKTKDCVITVKGEFPENSKYKTYYDAFGGLIDKTCGKGTWAKNPWVYCYTFKLIK